MIIEHTSNGNLLVTREPGAPRIGRESTFYYHVKKALQAEGHPVVRQVPDKDGHMHGAPFYIRDRRGAYCWIDEQYAIRSASEDYNHGSAVYLTFHRLS